MYGLPTPCFAWIGAAGAWRAPNRSVQVVVSRRLGGNSKAGAISAELQTARVTTVVVIVTQG
jgi:hypothetical protein